jgi:biopolymer transport protein ExbD
MAHRKVSNEATTEVELPVTPMLDMTFQLLVFFIITYHPSSLEGQMDFNLPATGAARATNRDNVDPDQPSDTDLSPKGAMTLTIKGDIAVGDRRGDISNIVVQMPNNGPEFSFQTPEKMYDFLIEIRKSPNTYKVDLENKNDIQVQADSTLKYSKVIKVVDLCRKAEFKGVGFAPPQDQPTGGQ